MTPDLLNLLAYCGIEAAREVRCAIPHPTMGPVILCDSVDALVIGEWVRGVIPLIKAVFTRTCVTDNCNGTGWVTQPIIRSMKRHDACGGTGKITDEHATLRIALACAEAAVDVFEQGMRDECSSSTMHDSPAITDPRKMLEAIAAWLENQTESLLRAWVDSLSEHYQGFVPMPFQCGVMLDYRTYIEESAKLVGRDTVRKIIVEVVTQECPTCSGPEGGDMEHELCGGTGRIAL